MQLESNLTGEQIQQVMDLFLYKAIEPIILNSDVFDIQVSYILCLISGNRKRKPSSLDRDKSINLLCQYLLTSDRSKKYDILRQARIERFFLHVFITRLLDHYPNYVSSYKRMLTYKKGRHNLKDSLDSDARSINTNRLGLYRILTISPSYIKHFYESRSIVLDHYVRLASKQAKIYIENNSGNFDFLDVRQSILKSVLLALDKYDSSKGALTSYINWWILNAQSFSIADQECNIAYTIPQTFRKKLANKEVSDVNYSVSMDDISDNGNSSYKKDLHTVVRDSVDVLKDLENTEEIDTVCYLAKCVDTLGIARLFLDIGEFFSDKERSLMKQHTNNDLLKCK